MHDWSSLSHVRWDCKYHIVFVPKYRKKKLYGKFRNRVGDLINEHLTLYKKIQVKDISQLEKRLSKAKGVKEQEVIKQDIVFQNKMLEAVKFMRAHETTILKFIQSFNNLLNSAVQKLGSQYPYDALDYLKNAHAELKKVENIYKKQGEIERYLLKLNRKNISLLKDQKKQ